jgi:SRSO17 transposase
MLQFKRIIKQKKEHISMKKSLNYLEVIVKKSFVYVLGLILVKDKRACTKIAKIFKVSHDSVNRFLSKNANIAALFPDLMIEMAKHFHDRKNGWLIVDDTALSKIHAKYIEGVHWIYNSSLRRPEKGLCIVVLAWTNGDITIPIGFRCWHSKKTDKENYKTKIQLACELMRETSEKLGIKKLLADAGYISKDMAAFLINSNIIFVTRIHSNRKVKTKNGIVAQMRNHPDLKLNRNERSKIVKVEMQGLIVYIVVFKRQIKHTNKYENVFLVTNIDTSAKEIIKFYGFRWEIEPMFRTMKQFIGLMQCSARAKSSQTAHINAVFLGYAFLQNEKVNKNFSCPEDSVRYLQELKPSIAARSFNRFCQEFCIVA